MGRRKTDEDGQALDVIDLAPMLEEATRGSGRQWRPRRGVWVIVGAGVVVAGAVSILLVVSSNGRPHAPRRPSNAAGPPSSAFGAQFGPLPGGQSAEPPQMVAFVDRRQGRGLTVTCDAATPVDQVCVLDVLATNDGGRTWGFAGRGRVAYRGSRGLPLVNFAVSGRSVWIYGDRTFASHDGGRTFTAEHVGGIVDALVPSRATVWAALSRCVACPIDQLVSAPVDGGRWHRIGRLPVLTGLGNNVVLLRPTPRVAYLVPVELRQVRDVLYVTRDAGQTWRMQRLPRVVVSKCCIASFTAAALGSNHIWLLASGDQDGLGNHQSKFLYRSDDAAVHWTLVADTNSMRPHGVGQLPQRGSVDTLAVTSLQRIWINNGYLIGTLDGGHTWFDTHVQTGLSQLDFVDPLHGWIWSFNGTARTTDGKHWTSVTTAIRRDAPLATRR